MRRGAVLFLTMIFGMLISEVNSRPLNPSETFMDTEMAIQSDNIKYVYGILNDYNIGYSVSWLCKNLYWK